MKSIFISCARRISAELWRPVMHPVRSPAVWASVSPWPSCASKVFLVEDRRELGTLLGVGSKGNFAHAGAGTARRTFFFNRRTTLKRAEQRGFHSICQNRRNEILAGAQIIHQPALTVAEHLHWQ